MSEHRTNDGVPEGLRTFLRTEFGGDGAEANWLLANAARTARSAHRPERRGVLSALFETLGAVFARPGSA